MIFQKKLLVCIYIFISSPIYKGLEPSSCLLIGECLAGLEYLSFLSGFFFMYKMLKSLLFSLEKWGLNYIQVTHLSIKAANSTQSLKELDVHHRPGHSSEYKTANSTLNLDQYGTAKPYETSNFNQEEEGPLTSLFQLLLLCDSMK